MDEKVQRLQYMLVENIYHNRNIETRFNFFVQYLTKKGIIDEKDYKEYLDDINKKMKLADEITKDESLSPEEKIAKAKQNDIPEEWVIEQKQAPEGAEVPATDEAEQKPESIIVTP
jgi:intergrase/recombinase